MKFSEYLKHRKLIDLDIAEVDLMCVSCQYNPDRFHHYKKAVEQAFPTVSDDVLQIRFSPHVWYALRHYSKTYIYASNPYRYMQLLYGKGATKIIEKVAKFENILDDIQKNGIKELPIVLIAPAIANRYNGSLEIYEGHHRLAAAFANGSHIQKVRLCRLED